MYCPNCGKTIDEGSTRCPSCSFVLSGGQSSRQSGSSSSAGSSLSSEYYATDAPAEAAKLSATICDALRQLGADSLRNPRRLQSFVMDCVPEEDRVGSTFVRNCDRELLEPLDKALRTGTPDAVEMSAMQVMSLLADDRTIVDNMARLVAKSAAEGIASYLGITVHIDLGGDSAQPPQADFISCPHCGARNVESASFCVACGSDLRAKVPAEQTPADQVPPERTPPDQTTPPGPSFVVCRTCGANNLVTDTYCSSCGQPLHAAAGAGHASASKRSRGALIGVVAALATVLVVLLVVVFGGKIVPGPGPSSGGSAGASDVAVDDDSGEKAEETDEDESDKSDKSDKYPDPVFTSVKASSTLEEDSGNYAPEQVLDGNSQTCWAEGSGEGLEDQWESGKVTNSTYDEAVGIGEWIELRASDEQHVQGITITNGYSKKKGDDWTDRSNGDTFYYDNTRVRGVTIELSDGYVEEATLPDSGPGVPYEIEFDEAHDTTYVRITIDSVYATSQDGGRATWPDTTIDEIGVF